MKDAFLFILVICNILFFVAGGLHLRSFERQILAEAVRQEAVDQNLFDASVTAVRERGDLEARVKVLEDFVGSVFKERKTSPVLRFGYSEEDIMLTKEEK